LGTQTGEKERNEKGVKNKGQTRRLLRKVGNSALGGGENRIFEKSNGRARLKGTREKWVVGFWGGGGMVGEG